MTIVDAIEIVLKDAESPLHYREITTRLLEHHLWITDGKTPDQTVNAQLSIEIKRHGEKSRFKRVGKGIYGLNGAYAGTHAEIEEPSPEPTKESPAPTAPVTTESLPFTQAAEHVLEKYGEKKPMHYRDITAKALADGLIVTQGKTPEATMYAQILSEIQRQTKRGERPRFAKFGKGYVGLARWMGHGLAFQIEEHNRTVRKQLLQQIRKMPPVDFEALVGRMLTAMGFDQVSVTPASGDGGIDVRGTLVVGDVVRTRMAVQVKRWSHNVQKTVVQQVRGSLGAHEQGLIITTSDFSKGACEEAERADATPVGLMNGEQLVNLLVEYDISIHRSSHDIIELGEEGEDA